MLKLKFKYLFIFMLLFICVITLPFTNAKYVINNYGIVWDNFFTNFSQITTNFVITDPKGATSESLYGAILDENLSSDTVKVHVYDEEFYYVKNSNFSSNYSAYNIGSLKNAEYSVVNQTPEDVVIIFQIHYYSRKITYGFPSYTTTLSFGIYNSFERTSVDHSISLTNKNDANNVLKGEVVVNTGESVFSNPNYSGLSEIVADRLSGSPTQQKVGGLFGSYYYTHRAIINPYAMLYNSGDPVPYKYKDNGVFVGNNRNGANAAFICPAYDANNESWYDNPELLEDFILNQGESASYVISLFNGDYGSTSKDNNAFIMSVEITAIPLHTVKSIIEEIRAGTKHTNYIPIANS